MKQFASTTGLRPLNAIRICLTLGLLISTLVVLKFIDGYIFCGFNVNFLVDLPVGIALGGACFIGALLGLAVNRKPATKCGKCCQCFACTLICVLVFAVCVGSAELAAFSLPFYNNARVASEMDQDPLNLCGSRNISAVKAEFSNLAPIFELIQRVDFIFKLLIAIGWFTPVAFCLAAYVAALIEDRNSRNDQLRPPAATDGSEEEGSIIWRAEHEKFVEFCSTAAKLETINEISGQPAAVDYNDEPALGDAIPEVCAQKPKISDEMETEKGRKSSDDDSNDAKSQFLETRLELGLGEE